MPTAAEEKQQKAERDYEALSSKQLSNAISVIPMLVSITPHEFFRHFKSAEKLNRWPQWIFDQSIDEPDDDDKSFQDECAERIICHLLVTKTAGHPTSNLLDECGDSARQHFKAVHGYFHRMDTSGRKKALKDFYNCKMANTNTNIYSFCALLNQRAKAYALHQGVTVTDDDKRCVLLDGLLPIFADIQLQLENAYPIPTYDEVCLRLQSHADAKGLAEATRGGSSKDRAKTFLTADDAVALFAKQAAKNHSVTDKSGQEKREKRPRINIKHGISYDGKPWVGGTHECQKFHLGLCKLDNCSFSHTPEAARGGGAKKNEHVNEHAISSTPADKTSGRCGWCDASDHPTAVCPSRFAKSRAQVNVAQAFAANVETPSANQSCNSWSLVKLILAIFSSILGAAVCVVEATGAGLRKITRGVFEIPQQHCILFCMLGLVAYAYANINTSTKAYVPTSVYLGETDSKLRGVLPAHEYEWCVDSGANRFITNNSNDFLPHSIEMVDTTVAVGGGNTISPMRGTVLVQSLDHNATYAFNNVLLLPDCSKKLIPPVAFTKQGCKITLEDDTVIIESASKKPILSGIQHGGLYYVHSKTVTGDNTITSAGSNSISDPGGPESDLNLESSISSDLTYAYYNYPAPDEADLDDEKLEGVFDTVFRKAASFFGLSFSGHNPRNSFGQRLLQTHQAMGHMPFKSIRKIFNLGSGDDPPCTACNIMRSRQAGLGKTKPNRATRPNQRAHMDTGYTAGKRFVFQLYVDDYSRFSHLDIIDSKTDAFAAFKEVQDHRNNLHAPYKLAFLRSDGGTEYDNKVFETYCSDEGIVHEWSGRHRHDQNGVAERRMLSIGGSFRCMMLLGNAPESDSAFALKHANVIINNSPTKANAGMTPKEKDMGVSLPFNRRLARAPLFCLTFAHVYRTEPARASNKDAARAVVCVYLGFDEVSYQYIVKEWDSGSVFYTADVEFQPTRFPYRASPTTMGQYLYQYEDITPHTSVRMRKNAEAEGKQTNATRHSARVHERTHSAGQDVTSIPDADSPPDNAAGSFLVLPYNTDPASWEEAMTQTEYIPDWIIARLKEKASFEEHEVYELVRRSEARGKRIFQSKEVLKVKMDPPTPEHPRGIIDKFKYRLTIQAFTKMLKPGVDYVEKYASTVRWEAIKLLFAIAVYMDYPIVLIDIATFFLNGFLDDEARPIFMEQPASWATADKPVKDWIWKLKKSMYGLPQAPNRAQKELHTALTKGHFVSTASDDCIYTVKSLDTGYAALGAHVDDIVSVGSDAGQQKAINALEARFKITKRVNPGHITGVEIERNFEMRWLKLHQTNYTRELLERYNMMDCKAVDTPMDAGTAKALMLLPIPNKCDEHNSGVKHDPTVVELYQKLIGELVWLCIRTRPDLRFAVSLLSRFVCCATQAHYDLARQRPLRYLKGTMSDGVVFVAGTGAWVVSGASDSDLAGDLHSQRSTLGHYLKLGEYGAIITHCGLERKLCTSTGQAETYAMAGLVKDVVWLRALMHELHFPLEEPTRLDTDNDGVFKQSTKVINHTTAKHYRINQAYIRSKVKELLIKVFSVNTAYNASDIFTKALPKDAFLRHKTTICGPQVAPSSAVD